MEFRTQVNLPTTDFRLQPFDRLLFVGSCFAQSIGSKMLEDKFQAVVNPYGVMYNPASVWHTIERYEGPKPNMVFVTLGTNRVYIEKSSGQIVDNCMKRPQQLFTEHDLTIEQCTLYLRRSIQHLQQINPQTMTVLTVSPIRYRKYGYHTSQLAKATLLLAIHKTIKQTKNTIYFPAYEILLDELRDYRFYNEDMLHPSQQTINYIYQQVATTFFSQQTQQFIKAWQPIKLALKHQPINPQSNDHKTFLTQLQHKIKQLEQQYPSLTTLLNNQQQ